MVSIDIRSVLQESDETWQVDWIETVRNRDGSLKEKPHDESNNYDVSGE